MNLKVSKYGVSISHKESSVSIEEENFPYENETCWKKIQSTSKKLFKNQMENQGY